MEWMRIIGVSLFFWCSALVYLFPLKARRSGFFWRLVIGLLAGNVLSVGGMAIWWEKGGRTWLFIWFYILILLFLFWCTKMRLPAILYCGVWVLLTQQIMLELWWFILQEPVMELKLSEPVLLLMQMCLFTAGLAAVAFTIARWMPVEGEYHIGPRQLGSALLLLVIFEMLMRVLGTGMDDFGFTFERFSIVFAQVYCLTILYMQNELFKKSAMREELRALNLLHRQQAEQYAVARENIDLINRKCHDLKHQIEAIRHVAGATEREEYLKEVEDSIQIYSAIVHTGNEVLDTLLTEKSLRCAKRNISVNCVADGKALAFLDPIDLYTIFGNAIDNAVESVEQLAEPEKRQIDVMVYRQQKFLMIHIVNPMARTLKFEGDLPVTTKKDKDYHGYGLKSIRRTAKKYDGFVSVGTQDGCFSLKILIPIQEDT